MTKKYHSLQILRFVAAFTVLLLHSSFYTHDRLTIIPTYLNGSNGVSLFFTISGFVMILSSQKLIGVTGSWKTFMSKRIIRIVPIYFLFTLYRLGTIILIPSLAQHTAHDAVFIIKSFLFLPALDHTNGFFPLYGVGWTLNFEMFYYLLFSLALALKKNPIVFTSFIFIPLAILSFYADPSWGDIRFYCSGLALNFIYGMLVAQLVSKNRKVPEWLGITLVIAGLVYLFTPGLNNNFDGISSGLATLCIIYGAACADDLISRYVPTFFVYLGGASYSLYLIHPSVAPIAPMLFKKINFIHPYWSVSLSVCISIIAAMIFYKLIENPLTAMLSKKRRGTASQPLPAVFTSSLELEMETVIGITMVSEHEIV